MKTLKITLAILTAALMTISCNEVTTGDVARVTNYPVFEKSGDDLVFVNLGSTFTDPGVTANEGGVEIPVTTSAVGQYRGGTSLDANVSDRYVLTYSATNKDGFAGTTDRTVYVVETGDLVTSIEGLYTATITRAGQLRQTDTEYTLIWKNNDGTYGMSCAFGSYYELGLSYGLPYAAQGLVITANSIPTSDFSFNSFTHPTWGGTITTNSLTVDPVNKTLNLDCDWDLTGWKWEVELKQVQI